MTTKPRCPNCESYINEGSGCVRCIGTRLLLRWPDLQKLDAYSALCKGIADGLVPERLNEAWDDDLLKLRGVGPKALAELRAVLAS